MKYIYEPDQGTFSTGIYWVSQYTHAYDAIVVYVAYVYGFPRSPCRTLFKLVWELGIIL